MTGDTFILTTQDPQAAWWILFIPATGAAIAIVITILYTFMAKKRNYDGYSSRLMIPLYAAFMVALIMFQILNGIQSGSLRDQKNQSLDAHFTDVNLSGDQFTGERKGVEYTGVLIEHEDAGDDYGRFTVFYVPTKDLDG